MKALSLFISLASAAVICNRDNTCSSADRTYSDQVPRAGQYQPWSQILLEEVGFPATQYVTIVNLTPHRFVVDKSRTHSYQFDIFDWDDIPQGRSRQNTAKYTSKAGASDVDDNGEVYYKIEGTNKQFHVRKTTHIPDKFPRRTIFDLSNMGLGQREYLDPGKESAVTLVITGSDEYGFTASLRHGKGNWMHGLYDVIKDRKVKHVFMPGTHDSGMSQISGKIKSIGSSANTQTQGINFYDQLRTGARLFDLRVGSVHNNDHTDQYSFWTLHVNDERSEIAIGNSGESLDAVINEVNQFTRENPGEMIFFRVRYMIGIRETPSYGPIFWDAKLVNDFFNQLKRVNNRCGNLDTGVRFNEQPASYFMDKNDGNGCVVFLLDQGNFQGDVPRDSVADGLYKSEMLDVWDNWSDMDRTDKVAKDQVADWKTVHRGGDNDRFLISQWLVSADAITSTALTLENIAVQPTNPALYWMGLNNMSPETYPTVSLVDYIGVVNEGRHDWDSLSAEMYTLAIGMNLYMASQNCAVSKQKSPLAKGKTKLAGVQSLFVEAQWNGIVFANGTVMDDARGMHPGRVPVLKSGTTFLNGTVVAGDVNNFQ